jgi:CRISPR-associated exonuclease Cas4
MIDRLDSLEEQHITGTMVAYFFVCKRKLWLYAKGLNMENISENTNVIKGKLLHETRFQRERNREFAFDNIKIDFLVYNDQVFVHEIKKSKKFENAHIWQLKFYIFNLRQKRVNCTGGVIHYPANMRRVEVDYGPEDDIKIQEALREIVSLLKQTSLPLKTEKKICSKCAYFDFCFA